MRSNLTSGVCHVRPARNEIRNQTSRIDNVFSLRGCIDAVRNINEQMAFILSLRVFSYKDYEWFRHWFLWLDKNRFWRRQHLQQMSVNTSTLDFIDDIIKLINTLINERGKNSIHQYLIICRILIVENAISISFRNEIFCSHSVKHPFSN